jgi:hypothetical protein
LKKIQKFFGSKTVSNSSKIFPDFRFLCILFFFLQDFSHRGKKLKFNAPGPTFLIVKIVFIRKGTVEKITLTVRKKNTGGKDKETAGLTFRKSWLKMQLAETALTDVREYL